MAELSSRWLNENGCDGLYFPGDEKEKDTRRITVTEPYRPRITHKIEVYQRPNGSPMPHADRLVGEVVGIGAGIREGYCRVKLPFGSGHVHNWYRFSQVREV
jgi:hypothetical protein